METIVLALMVGIVCLLLGFFAGRYLWPAAKASDQAALSVAQLDTARANEAKDEARQRADSLEEE